MYWYYFPTHPPSSANGRVRRWVRGRGRAMVRLPPARCSLRACEAGQCGRGDGLNGLPLFKVDVLNVLAPLQAALLSRSSGAAMAHSSLRRHLGLGRECIWKRLFLVAAQQGGVDAAALSHPWLEHGVPGCMPDGWPAPVGHHSRDVEHASGCGFAWRVYACCEACDGVRHTLRRDRTAERDRFDCVSAACVIYCAVKCVRCVESTRVRLSI